MTNQLSRGQAIAFGLLLMGIGLLPILIAAGIVGQSQSRDTPSWVVACIGLVFLQGGLALIVGYAIAPGIDASGNLDPSTPFGVQLLQLVLVAGIIAAMTAAFGWVAFGSGERSFSQTSALGGVAVSGRANARTGRIAFGVATVLFVAAFFAIVVSGGRRLMRVRRSPQL